MSACSIKFTDVSLNESYGNFMHTSEIMGKSKWMIETKATVVTDFIVCSYILHMWHHGEVSIMETDHPPYFENADGVSVPDDDIRCLFDWVNINGWNKLSVHDDLLDGQRNFEFWLSLYRAGLISNKMLHKYDNDELNRQIMR